MTTVQNGSRTAWVYAALTGLLVVVLFGIFLYLREHRVRNEIVHHEVFCVSILAHPEAKTIIVDFLEDIGEREATEALCPEVI